MRASTSPILVYTKSAISGQEKTCEIASGLSFYDFFLAIWFGDSNICLDSELSFRMPLLGNTYAEQYI
jgi:hypothetical protein